MINSNVNGLFLNKDRSDAIRTAEDKNYDLAILDDGFQDFSIKKNLNIICFNERQMIGNGMTLPSGPLRESINAIRKAQIIVINGPINKKFEEQIANVSNKIKIFYSNYMPSNIDQFKNKKLFAFAGIGNPDNFFKLLTNNGLNLKKSLSFPDHYQFTKSEIQKIVNESAENELDLITTEKDFYRIKNLGFTNIKCLKIDLQIIDKVKFIKEILNYL